ncbi:MULTISPECIES: YggT family protein [unclassified Cryobacterium]|uniref:YggT family protein n=1 Tax=unclassified Cryobacterium TaxID=2649013 RepID=UPI00106C51CC|nr:MULTISPECIES: YggT family protein [unclassified Cryobacterium]MDY7527554.1 YggT family protein [Cryobacterium sp. 10C2]MDY7556663.1 YggT family protein [Cryobacterium sp. 10C3]MEB0004822.1 YggT family protein [Cryobacterium sp. RTC2.1]MEB0201943.1 YggT family protein [Cryobacterium sp. 5I3]MEB0288149.1 YggT family protein [Cryobacterium sp. 10S3]
MFVVTLLAWIIYYALLLYFFVMWGRFIVDLVRSVNRSWRPQGITLVLVEFIYVVTDPPVKFFRRILPPLRVGPIAFDFGWSLTMLCTIIGMGVVGALR